METKAMLPDSTQSEAPPPASSSSAIAPPPSSRHASSGSKTSGNASDKSKKKRKRKSEDRSGKSCKKKKKQSKEHSHKEQNPSGKSKKGSAEAKKPEPSEEQDSDLDLDKDLKPIRDYVKDREEMLQHMFKSVLKANKLTAMLPVILKDVKVDELQQLCLLQLEGMSKSRIMSVLAGEEMQSSSDDEESDSDLEREPSKPDENVGDDENLINSEVVDSTSSLPQASESIGDVEEAVSALELEEEAAGEETNIADSDVDDDHEAEEDDASLNDSWHDDGGEQQGSDNEERDVEDRDVDDEVSDSRDDDRRDGQAGSSAVDEEEVEEVVVKKPKRLRHFKIVRAEGEECEEGEITSDDETDEESDSSSKKDVEEEPTPEDDTGDCKTKDTHPGEGVTEESHTNPGNQDDDKDDDFVDIDRNRAHVVVDLNVAKDTINESNANVTVDVVSDPDVDKIPADVVKGLTSDSLNVFAEDAFDAEESDARKSSQTVGKESDVIDNVADDVATQDNANPNDNVADPAEVDSDSRSDTDNNENVTGDEASADDADGADKIADENSLSVAETSGPSSQGPGVSNTPQPSGRKVAQQLEVLELELRARAIRSLMKQYGKDVG